MGKHSRPQSSSLLCLHYCAWLTARRAFGNPGTNLFRYLLLVETKKTLLIGQYVTRLNLNERWEGCPGLLGIPFLVFFLCKSQIVHAIVKCTVFRGSSVCRQLQNPDHFSSALFSNIKLFPMNKDVQQQRICWEKNQLSFRDTFKLCIQPRHGQTCLKFARNSWMA